MSKWTRFWITTCAGSGIGLAIVTLPLWSAWFTLAIGCAVFISIYIDYRRDN